MYRYRCDQCRTTSLPVATRAEARRQRDLHRYRMHGGHVPDGERLQRYRWQPRDVRPLLWISVLVVLLLLGWIGR